MSILKFKKFFEQKFGAGYPGDKVDIIGKDEPYTHIDIDPKIEQQFTELLTRPGMKEHWKKYGSPSYALVQGFCKEYGYEFQGHGYDVNSDELKYIYNKVFYPERNKKYRSFRGNIVKN